MNNITNYDRLKVIQKIITDECEYTNFLRFSKKFYDLDYKNQLLIYLQHPGATKVNTFIDWKKEGRNVKKNPRKIFLYGYYRKKQNSMLDGQIDIKGKENKKRKATIEYFNDVPYRRVCNYDLADTYIDRKSKILAKPLKTEKYYTEQEILDSLIATSPMNMIKQQEDNNIVDGADNIVFYPKFTLFQNVSLIIHQMCHYIVNNKVKLENGKLKRLIGESVGFSVANYFGFDTKIYTFKELVEFEKLDINNKVDIGSIIQKESKDFINTILERLENKEQISA